MILEGFKYVFNLVSPFLLLVLREIYLFVSCFLRKYYINYVGGDVRDVVDGGNGGDVGNGGNANFQLKF
jgi:hypothetical protein